MSEISEAELAIVISCLALILSTVTLLLKFLRTRR